MDHHSMNGYITASYMLAALARSGLHLSKQAVNLIINYYALPSSEAIPLLEVRYCAVMLKHSLMINATRVCADSAQGTRHGQTGTHARHLPGRESHSQERRHWPYQENAAPAKFL